MNRLLLAACAMLLCACKEEPKTPAFYEVDKAAAATVSGQIKFTGKAPAGKRISMEAEEGCAALHQAPGIDRPVRTGPDGGLADVVVYVKSGLEGKKFAPAEDAVPLDQRGCRFVPRVVALRTGQTLAVKNSDPVSHNIHPMPKNNRDWNQQQSPGAADLRRRFGFAEVAIPVKCNVHRWMKSYIAVLDHPYFTVTGENGKFTLADLPPGTYTLAVWHETLGEQTAPVTLPPSQSATVDFLFSSTR